jgi:hypothetical protein
MTPDLNSPTPNTNQNSGDQFGLGYFLWDTMTGLCCYVFFGIVFAAVYVGVFGYGLGHMIHYALVDTLAIPITFDTCFYWGLIPVLNIIGFCLASYILMWKFLLLLALKVFLWLLGVLPGFLDAWAKNIQR